MRHQFKRLRAGVNKTWLSWTSQEFFMDDANAVIIAPHPDDEALGCGGYIASKLRRNNKLRIVFLTRGEAAYRHRNDLSEIEVAKARTAATMESVAKAGGDASMIRWLDLPDLGVPGPGAPGGSEAVTKIRSIMSEIGATEIIAPHRRDNHSDHQAAAALVDAAVGNDTSIRQVSWIVWAWILIGMPPMNPLLDGKACHILLKDIRETKIAMIDSHLKAKIPGTNLPTTGLLEENIVTACSRPKEFLLVKN